MREVMRLDELEENKKLLDEYLKYVVVFEWYKQLQL